MPEANRYSREYWNGEGGQRWVREAVAHERQLEPFVVPLLDAADLAPGQRVLDIGCGSGPTTRAAGERVGPAGRVVGVDISRPLVESARATTEFPSVTYVEADVQVAPLTELAGGLMDRAISRFGVMFFDDPTAAFANVRAALDGDRGHLAFVCWRGIEDNDWMRVPGQALTDLCGVEFVPPGRGSGPYGLADPSFVTETLVGAGYRDVALEPFDLRMPIGGGMAAPEAGALLFEAVKQFLPEGGEELGDRDVAMAAVVDALRPYEDDAGAVAAPAGAWIVTATA